MIKAFIFDVDGTLVDTRQQHIDSWLRAFKEFGIEVTAQDIQSQLGKRAIEIAKTLLQSDKSRLGESRRIVEEKWRIFKQYHPTVKPMPMTKELFNLLHQKGMKLALATSTIRRDAEFYVDLLSARDLIGALVTADDIKKSKPDPEIFLKAAEKLGVEPPSAVVVGDSPHDIKAAVSAGMLAIGVLTGGYSKEELASSGANKIYPDIQGLYDHIGEILR